MFSNIWIFYKEGKRLFGVLFKSTEAVGIKLVTISEQTATYKVPKRFQAKYYFGKS